MTVFSSGYDSSNLFAKIVRGEIPCDLVYQNDYCLVFKDIRPRAQTHLLLIPRGPFTDILSFSRNASDEEIMGLFGAVSRFATGDRFSIFTNARDGPLEKQEVMHFHLHLVSDPIVHEDVDCDRCRGNTEWILSDMTDFADFTDKKVVPFVRSIADFIGPKSNISGFNARLVKVRGKIAWRIDVAGVLD